MPTHASGRWEDITRQEVDTRREREAVQPRREQIGDEVAVQTMQRQKLEADKVAARKQFDLRKTIKTNAAAT